MLVEVVPLQRQYQDSLCFMDGRTSIIFHVVGEDSKNLWVHCTLCGGSKTFSSTRDTNSNFFKKHLNMVHKNANLIAK